MKKSVCRILIAGVLSAALVLYAVGCGNTDTEISGSSKSSDDSLQKVLDAGQLVLGLDDNYPPMGFVNEKGEIDGFDIDMAQEVCDRLGIGLVKKPIDWAAKEDELNKGTIDCIWNGMTVSPERKESMNLSDPYLRSERVFVVRGDSGAKSVSDLTGLTVGVQSGSMNQEVLESSGLSADIKILKFSDNLEIMQKLKQGTLNAALIGSIAAYYYISVSNERFFVLPESFGKEELAIGFRKGDQTLRDRVQETINEMKADGTLKKISTKWFGSDITIVK